MIKAGIKWKTACLRFMMLTETEGRNWFLNFMSIWLAALPKSYIPMTKRAVFCGKNFRLGEIIPIMIMGFLKLHFIMDFPEILKTEKYAITH